jgi:hypothetical protein
MSSVKDSRPKSIYEVHPIRPIHSEADNAVFPPHHEKRWDRSVWYRISIGKLNGIDRRKEITILSLWSLSKSKYKNKKLKSVVTHKCFILLIAILNQLIT